MMGEPSTGASAPAITSAAFMAMPSPANSISGVANAVAAHDNSAAMSPPSLATLTGASFPHATITSGNMAHHGADGTLRMGFGAAPQNQGGFDAGTGTAAGFGVPQPTPDLNPFDEERVRLQLMFEERALWEKKTEHAKLNLADRLLSTISDVLKANPDAALGDGSVTSTLLAKSIQIAGLTPTDAMGLLPNSSEFRNLPPGTPSASTTSAITTSHAPSPALSTSQSPHLSAVPRGRVPISLGTMSLAGTKRPASPGPISTRHDPRILAGELSAFTRARLTEPHLVAAQARQPMAPVHWPTQPPPAIQPNGHQHATLSQHQLLTSSTGIPGNSAAFPHPAGTGLRTPQMPNPHPGEQSLFPNHHNASMPFAPQGVPLQTSHSQDPLQLAPRQSFAAQYRAWGDGGYQPVAPRTLKHEESVPDFSSIPLDPLFSNVFDGFGMNSRPLDAFMPISIPQTIPIDPSSLLLPLQSSHVSTSPGLTGNLLLPGGEQFNPEPVSVATPPWIFQVSQTFSPPSENGSAASSVEAVDAGETSRQKGDETHRTTHPSAGQNTLSSAFESLPPTSGPAPSATHTSSSTTQAPNPAEQPASSTSSGNAPNAALSKPAPAATTNGTSSRIHQEIVVLCTGCHKMVLTAHLFGEAEALSKPYVFDVECVRCRSFSLGGAGDEERSSNEPRRKKRRRNITGGRDAHVECKICSAHIGWGGPRLVTAYQPDQFVWVEPEFGTELICTKCTNTFRFCTNCGGGGKFRSGKWRPIELFSPGRKNCTIDHTRLRNPKTSRYIVYRLPVRNSGSSHVRDFEPTCFGPPPSKIPYADKPASEAIDDMVRDVLEFYRFASLASGAEAAMMLVSPWAETWQKFCEWRQTNLIELERLLRGLFDPEVPREIYDHKEYRRYLSLAVSPSGKSRKWKMHSEGGGDASKVQGPQPPPPADVFSADTDYTIVGFSIFNWHVTDRHCFHRFTTCLGQYSLAQGSMIPSLLLSAERRVEQDLGDRSVVSMTLRNSQSKKNIIPELVRVGFKYMDAYANEIGMSPHAARELFRNHVMPPETYERMKILCLPYAQRSKIMASLSKNAVPP
ncbi:hypothetical protein HDU96_006080 [Phlyctochytrium bullatum]|nr:hypothetical protein HDU96_006080 [Phlyctochytrium bullatum]